MPATVIGGVGTILVALLWMRLFPALRQVEGMLGAEAVPEPFNFYSPRRACFHLYAIDADGDHLRQLTGGPDRDIYPVFESEGSILFTRFPAAEAAPVGGGGAAAVGAEGGGGDVAQIFRLQLKRVGPDGRPAAFPLTSGTLSALAPIPVADGFLFVAGPGSGRV